MLGRCPRIDARLSGQACDKIWKSSSAVVSVSFEIPGIQADYRLAGGIVGCLSNADI